MMPSADDRSRATSEPADLGLLFHRLNNQLGVLLAQAELLEAKAADDAGRARAAQMVSSTLATLGTVREIRHCTELTTAS